MLNNLTSSLWQLPWLHSWLPPARTMHLVYTSRLWLVSEELEPKPHHVKHPSSDGSLAACSRVSLLERLEGKPGVALFRDKSQLRTRPARPQC